LEIAAGGRLEGKAEALFDQTPLDRADQIETLADCPCGREQLIGSEISGLHARHITGPAALFLPAVR
jgi:hypothetical protein